MKKNQSSVVSHQSSVRRKEEKKKEKYWITRSSRVITEDKIFTMKGMKNTKGKK